MDETTKPADEGVSDATPELMDRRRFGKLAAAAGGAAAVSFLTPRWTAPFVEVSKLAALEYISRQPAPGKTENDNTSCPVRTKSNGDRSRWISIIASDEGGTLVAENRADAWLVFTREGDNYQVTAPGSTILRPTGEGASRVLPRGHHRIDIRVPQGVIEYRVKLEPSLVAGTDYGYFELTLEFCHKR